MTPEPLPLTNIFGQNDLSYIPPDGTKTPLPDDPVNSTPAFPHRAVPPKTVLSEEEINPFWSNPLIAKPLDQNIIDPMGPQGMDQPPPIDPAKYGGQAPQDVLPNPFPQKPNRPRT